MPVVWKPDPAEYKPVVDVVRTAEQKRILGLDHPARLLYNERLEPMYTPKGKRA